ncbi:MAG TPA: amidohydrolase family protein [Thermodesulfovibrionales bacterium]|nr:amidohydrolase family protein [Thermodesulfovibrionales bacterium]
MKGIIDFHTHAFPDDLSERVIKMLEDEGGVKACLDGKISSLISSMDRCGIEKSVICNIATKPSQFDPILKWCGDIRSERIVPFPSLHPYDSAFKEKIDEIRLEGFKGIKFHPYYQNFTVDEERLLPVYERISHNNLILVMHTGFDFAFPRTKIADPEKIDNIVSRFPSLKLVTTHLGAWQQWEEVERFLLGKQIYMEISFALEYLDVDAARKIFLKHPKEYILFGTDSPWTEQHETISLLKKLELGKDREELIFRENAARLFASV